MGPRTGLNAAEETSLSRVGNRIQPVARRYTDWTLRRGEISLAATGN
jgi:hypothetical protein